ncbi:Polysaccharide biosynthesis/export protein [Rhodobacteraceae bacterium THAF1]|uniref:polysaccharide biosynthesis/export family protein n=1 Tax=Palleronia sp. THAF1 TaxID=2587842 RepID=UPI000F3E8E65|nr:polysaccharide biosynthesis/export family protein [Palleronia sp. THAF1]QFU10071.1 Polysaccharide biosynthesis/export protein [Palleronia sp. THAF1]VDC17024.1 Polysaccharide biosynthesis/export protein [Rhodobacteraceae bacterium THAF1]
MKRGILGALAIVVSMSGCGISYIDPAVGLRNTSANVEVTQITLQTIPIANNAPYTPKTLPEVFYQATGGGSAGAGVSGLPAAPFVPNEQRRPTDLRLPPPVDNGPYRIGVGDSILIATRAASSTVEELSGLLAAQNQRQGYTVRDDGSISIPDVGTIDVAGSTVEEAEANVFQALVEAGFNPSFSLEIADFNSQRVVVGGAVAQTAILPITITDLTLDTAIAGAGGVTAPDEEFASIRIYRDGTLYQIPYEQYLARPELRDTQLTGGDAVFVDTTYDLDRALRFYSQQIDVIGLRQQTQAAALSQLQTEIGLRRAALNEQRDNFRARTELDGEDRDYVYLAGEVATQARFPLPYGRQASLADVLFASEGFETETANAREIYVLRASGDTVTAWRLNAANAINLALAPQFEMRPNDIVFIETQPITSFNRAISQALPNLISVTRISQ